MTRIYRDKEPVSVLPFTGAEIIYGFLTNIKTADRTTLGQTAVTNASNALKLVFGCNSPKPGRVTIDRATESVNSFYDIGQKNALRAAGYRVTSPKNRTGRVTNKAVPVYVTMPGGWKYAWYMRKVVFDKISADLNGLGIQQAQASDTDLIWGVNNVKPAKARKEYTGVDGTDVVTVYIDDSSINSLPTGWALVPSSNAVALT